MCFQEDRDEIINAMRGVTKSLGLLDTADNCWATFINKVKANLHVAFTASPVGEAFRVRSQVSCHRTWMLLCYQLSASCSALCAWESLQNRYSSDRCYRPVGVVWAACSALVKGLGFRGGDFGVVTVANMCCQRGCAEGISGWLTSPAFPTTNPSLPCDGTNKQGLPLSA